MNPANIRMECLYVFRSMMRTPMGVTAALASAVLACAFGSGVLSILISTTWGSLPYRDAESIVGVVTQTARGGALTSRMTEADYSDLRTARSFTAITHYSTVELPIGVHGQSIFSQVSIVDPSFTSVLTPKSYLVGGPFKYDDAGTTVVLSEGFARRTFGSATDAMKGRISIQGKLVEVVGVVSSLQSFPQNTDIWEADNSPAESLDRSAFNYEGVLGRLSPHVSYEQAQGELNTFSTRLAVDFPETNLNRRFFVRPFRQVLFGDLKHLLALISFLVGAFVLIAILNISHVAVAMVLNGRADTGVRLMLGAPVSAFVWLPILETLFLCTFGGLLGFVSSLPLARVISHLGLSSYPNGSSLTGFGIAALSSVAFSGALVAICSFTTFAALAACDYSRSLEWGKTRGITARYAKRARFALIAGEALSCFLLVVFGISLALPLTHLIFIDPGYRVAQVLVVELGVTEPGKQAAVNASRLIQSFTERLRVIPGVLGVASTRGLPNIGFVPSGSVGIRGGVPISSPLAGQANFVLVSPQYLPTMNISLLRGREFTIDDDLDHIPTAVISESLAHKAFGDSDPIGRMITCGYDSIDVWMTVVGVVSDIRQHASGDSEAATIYMPLSQHILRASKQQVVVYSTLALPGLEKTVRNIAQERVPALAFREEPLADTLSGTLDNSRLKVMLVSVIVGFGIVLSFTGVYGICTYAAAQRTFEFALRSAFGAQPEQLMSLLMREVSAPCLLGIVCGILLTPLVTHLERMTLGARGPSWYVMLGASLTILLAALLAAIRPSLSISKSEGLDVLRA